MIGITRTATPLTAAADASIVDAELLAVVAGPRQIQATAPAPAVSAARSVRRARASKDSAAR
jgi:hypothetical protein